MPIPADRGIKICVPRLSIIIHISMVEKVGENKPSPSIPREAKIIPTMAILVLARKESIPKTITIRTPGSSRGNSTKPLAAAVNLYVSLKKLLNTVEFIPLAIPVKRPTIRNNLKSLSLLNFILNFEIILFIISFFSRLSSLSAFSSFINFISPLSQLY